VESIRDHRINFRKKKIEFLIKWRNFAEEENTWQSFALFTQDQPKMVKEYLIHFFDNRGHLEYEMFKKGSAGNPKLTNESAKDQEQKQDKTNSK